MPNHSGGRDSQSSAGPQGGPRAGARRDTAFDIWLQRGLHELYDTVAHEPVPDSLLRLIELDRTK